MENLSRFSALKKSRNLIADVSFDINKNYVLVSALFIAHF